MAIESIEIILYVRDQEESTRFYQKIFRKPPALNVPGMTEFILAPNCKVGLMPNHGMARILAGKTPHPEEGFGIPRCELYLLVDEVHFEFENARKHGAIVISPVTDREWGHTVCYFSDLDGHILAFAEKSKGG